MNDAQNKKKMPLWWKIMIGFGIALFLNAALNATHQEVRVEPLTDDQKAELNCSRIHGRLDNLPISQLSLSDFRRLRICREAGL